MFQQSSAPQSSVFGCRRNIAGPKQSRPDARDGHLSLLDMKAENLVCTIFILLAQSCCGANSISTH